MRPVVFALTQSASYHSFSSWKFSFLCEIHNHILMHVSSFPPVSTARTNHIKSAKTFCAWVQVCKPPQQHYGLPNHAYHDNPPASPCQCSPEPSRYISALSLKTSILPASLIKQIDLALLYVLFSCVCFCPVSDIALQSPSSQPPPPNWLYLEGQLEVTNAWRSILRNILTSSQTGDNVLWSLPASAMNSGKVATQQRLQFCSRHGCNKGLRVESGLALFCN